MIKLQSNKTDLTGEWKLVGGKVVSDEACERINLLTSQHLEHIAVGNWEKLYRDPEDGRYWELTYPHSDWHGGGPPRLTCLSEEEAQTKYGVV